MPPSPPDNITLDLDVVDEAYWSSIEPTQRREILARYKVKFDEILARLHAVGQYSNERHQALVAESSYYRLAGTIGLIVINICNVASLALEGQCTGMLMHWIAVILGIVIASLGVLSVVRFELERAKRYYDAYLMYSRDVSWFTDAWFVTVGTLDEGWSSYVAARKLVLHISRRESELSQRTAELIAFETSNSDAPDAAHAPISET